MRRASAVATSRLAITSAAAKTSVVMNQRRATCSAARDLACIACWLSRRRSSTRPRSRLKSGSSPAKYSRLAAVLRVRYQPWRRAVRRNARSRSCAALDVGDHLALARLGDVAGGTAERAIEARAVLPQLRPAPLGLAQQDEQRGGILALEALLHVLRGDHRVVVVGDDPSRHAASSRRCQALHAPSTDQRQDEHQERGRAAWT